MVLAGDLDLAGDEVLDRVVRAPMAHMHLLGLRPQRQRQHLVAQADAEDRLAAVHQLLDLRHRIGAGRRRIARPVRQEHPVGIVRQDLVRRGLGRHHRHPAALGDQIAQDVALGPEIHRDHVELGVGGRLEAVVLPVIGEAPQPAVPGVGLGAGHGLGQIHTGQARPLRRQLLQRRNIEGPVRAVLQGRVRRAAVADPAGQPAGIDARDARQIDARQPVVQMAVGPIVGRIGDIGPQHAAQRGRGDGLHIVDVRPHIADMREGEGDDLSGIGRVGQDFLVTGHRGVEADLPHPRHRSTQAAPPDQGAVGQGQNRGGAGRRRIWIGRVGCSLFGCSLFGCSLGRGGDGHEAAPVWCRARFHRALGVRLTTGSRWQIAGAFKS